MAQMKTITPDVWGGPMWRTIHVVALGYPRNAPLQVREAYKAFYDSLRAVIPCAECRRGYIAIADALPVEAALGNREDLFNWTVNVHNKVNEKLNRPPMTADYVRDVYIHGGDGDGDPAVDRANMKGAVFYVSAFLLIALTAWLVYLLFRGRPRRLGRA
eukprot:jgi/Tetstr1/454231/TSEL_041150.t1